MTQQQIIDEIDQLVFPARQAFGKHSAAARLLEQAGKSATQQKETEEQDVRDSQAADGN